MDIASLVGVLLGAVMVVFGIISSGGVAAMGNFIDVPSILITIGGSLSSVMGGNKLADFINGLKSISLPFKENAKDPGDTIKTIINLANVGRKEGLLALEEAANGIEDDLFKKCIVLVVDGTDA